MRSSAKPGLRSGSTRSETRTTRSRINRRASQRTFLKLRAYSFRGQQRRTASNRRRSDRPLLLGLQGSVSAPTSGLHIDCNKKSVTVESRPAQVFLNNIGMDGPPKVFPNGILFSPPGAWVAVPGTSNDWLDLALTFANPPGRVPVGTATSVILDTDCGVRWVDLGVIPPDHKPPTAGDILEMISQCMAISDSWGLGVMNLGWLVDPPGICCTNSIRCANGRLESGSCQKMFTSSSWPWGLMARSGSSGRLAAVKTLLCRSRPMRMRRCSCTAEGLSAPAPVVFQGR